MQLQQVSMPDIALRQDKCTYPFSVKHIFYSRIPRLLCYIINSSQ